VVLERWLSVVPASTTQQRRPGLDCGNCSLDDGLTHLVQPRDCPGVSAGVSACYTVPASSQHVLDKALKLAVHTASCVNSFSHSEMVPVFSVKIYGN